jgi:hypothetical protein
LRFMEAAVAYEDDFAETQFQIILQHEENLSKAKTELQKATTLFGQAVNGAEKKLADAWKEMEAYMASTGEFELEFPAPAGQKYVVNWSTPRQSVKVVDDAAVPDEFCRVKREPDKKKIKEELESGKAHNWASLEYGEKHLQWRSVKNG